MHLDVDVCTCKGDDVDISRPPEPKAGATLSYGGADQPAHYMTWISRSTCNHAEFLVECRSRRSIEFQ